MPPMVLLDATPLRGPGGDRADAAVVRGLIGGFRRRPEQERPHLLLAPGCAAPPGFVPCRLSPRPWGLGRATCRTIPWRDVPDAVAADLVHLTSTEPIAAPRQISTCLDLIPLRFPALAFGAGSGAARRRYNAFLDRLAWARLVLVPTQAVARDVTELLGIPESRVRVVGLGAPPVTEPGTPSGDPPVILVVANREPYTNAALAVRALAAVDRRHEAHLVIVGVDDRHRRDRLRRLAAALGVSARTVVSGSLGEARMADLRRTAAVALVPSYADGVSVPALAALAAGLPVLASDIPELAELLGPGRAHIPGFTPPAWAAALEDLLSDGAARARLSADGHARASALSWRDCADATWGCYLEAGDA